eukprot:NODE_220_length_13988_cov_0.426885.p5 type:complete len:150 gc:universal NODE_220_length_13988_cov_0.426885:13188-13637(+)
MEVWAITVTERLVLSVFSQKFILSRKSGLLTKRRYNIKKYFEIFRCGKFSCAMCCNWVPYLLGTAVYLCSPLSCFKLLKFPRYETMQNVDSEKNAIESTVAFNKMINKYRKERGAYLDRNTGVWQGTIEGLASKSLDGEIKTYSKYTEL